jgi:hypothetical protein
MYDQNRCLDVAHVPEGASPSTSRLADPIFDAPTLLSVSVSLCPFFLALESTSHSEPPAISASNQYASLVIVVRSQSVTPALQRAARNWNPVQ